MHRKSHLLIILFALLACIVYGANNRILPTDYYDNLINQAKKSNKPDTTIAKLYMDYQYQIYISDINKAIRYLLEAEKIYARLNDAKHLAFVKTRLGQVYHQLQMYNIALNHLSTAHTILLEKKEYTSAAYTNCDIGNIFFAFNQFSIAESYYRNSLTVFEKYKDDYGKSVMYNNIGLCKMSINQPDSALHYFKTAFSLRLKRKDRYVINHSNNYLATAYTALRDYPKAIELYNLVIDDINNWDDAPQHALQLKAEVQFNLRNLYHEKKDRFMASKYLEDALVSYNNINDTAGTIKTLLAMAKDEYADKEYQDAIQHGEAAYLLSDIKGLLITSQKVSGFLTKVYLDTGNIGKAKKYLSVYSALSDSTLNQYSSSGLTQTHASIQTFYKNAENRALKMKDKLTMRYLLIIAILLVFVLVMYFYVLFTKRSSIKNLKSLADATFEGIVIHDNGKILEVNDQLCRMSGFDRTELINQDITNLKCVQINDNIKSCISSKDTASYETTVYAKDGRCAEVEVVSKPLYYKNKMVRVVAMRDITDRKRFINELIQSNQQNRELIATKDKILSIIGHDLKNPFNAIIGFSEILKKDIEKFGKDEQVEMLTLINESSRYAHDLLNNLLDWAMVQTGSLKYKPERLLINEQINPILSIVNSNAQAKELDLIHEIEDNCYVFADSRMLRTILLNLISNAIKFTPKSGRIILKAGREGNGTQIKLSDTGIGIDPANLKSLFDTNNMQSTKGTENEPGTGLGLILCKELIARHDGTFEVVSTPGQGTIFTITLPDIA